MAVLSTIMTASTIANSLRHRGDSDEDGLTGGNIVRLVGASLVGLIAAVAVTLAILGLVRSCVRSRRRRAGEEDVEGIAVRERVPARPTTSVPITRPPTSPHPDLISKLKGLFARRNVDTPRESPETSIPAQEAQETPSPAPEMQSQDNFIRSFRSIQVVAATPRPPPITVNQLPPAYVYEPRRSSEGDLGLQRPVTPLPKYSRD